ncbi:hypothetical protein [Paenibacillus puerhi]|uniref:hypothetical protein n=1 Tax=Paenibacillus puerhi TaxID=2692622 RepID=UPI00135803AC|nr:hypothetical protein [Paenibacillus puerhi]
MDRFHMITYVFPTSNETEREWSYFFYKLLKEIPSFNKEEIFCSSFSETALPSTEFRTGNTTTPMIIFNTHEKIDMNVANLSICDKNSKSIKFSSLMVDGINSVNNYVTDANTISNLFHQLKGRLTGIDHTGINIPVTKLQKSKWDELITKMSKISNLYKYPGEDWPFIIPADETEYLTDITRFAVKRTPKFEFVYDSYADRPIFQFALETNISKEDMERIFPDPIGFAIPGLENIFRSIFIQNPWEHEVAIRFDLYYKSTANELTDWETGEWLVTNGGRLKQEA